MLNTAIVSWYTNWRFLYIIKEEENKMNWSLKPKIKEI
jgi:sRNA-binding protein